jgi:arylsulfatase A-like enzyme
MRVRLALWIFFFVAILHEIHNKGGGIRQELSLPNMAIVLSSILGCISAFLVVESFQSQKIRALGSFFYGISFFYFYRVNGPFSFEVVANNYEHLVSLSSLFVVAKLTYATFFASDVFWTLVFTGLVVAAGRVRSARIVKNKSQYLAISGITLILILSFGTSTSFDPFLAFGQSIYAHFVPVRSMLQTRSQTLPLLKNLTSQSQFTFPKKPNIFLILVESFNSRFVNQKDATGVEYLPYFNELTKNHLYFSNYFSNSIQTAKGHFAALCGQVPMIRGIEFQSSECMDKACIPTILAENGYKTYFFQSDPNFNSDNSQNFMKSHGFQSTPELVKSCREEKSKCYSFGIRDHLYYERVFDFLGKDDPRNDDTPIFAAIATVSTHMPFSFQDEHERPIYKKPKNFKEQYLNTIRMADDSLRHFVEEFELSGWAEDSVLIITGDHAYPTGEHESIHNDTFAYQENFGVPLLIYDRRQNLKSLYGAQEKVAFSHLNLGMTVLDIAQIESPTDWFAPSVLNLRAPPIPVYLVQPYSGGYQATIDWPYKHIYSEFRQQDVIYDLEKDPHERSPLTDSQRPEVFDKMRSMTAQIYRQQEVFNCSITNPNLTLRSPAAATGTIPDNFAPE